MTYYIDFESTEAYYRQLRDQIVLSIACEELAAGDSLPSVRDMADIIGINMHTVNKAYALLRREGYIRLDRRSGAVISSRRCIDEDGNIAALKEALRVSLAEACCKGISEEDIHACVDEVLKQINGGR